MRKKVLSATLALAAFVTIAYSQKGQTPFQRFQQEVYYNRWKQWTDDTKTIHLENLKAQFARQVEVSHPGPSICFPSTALPVPCKGVQFTAPAVNIYFSNPGSPTAMNNPPGVPGLDIGATLWDDVYGDASANSLTITINPGAFAVSFWMANGCNGPCPNVIHNQISKSNGGAITVVFSSKSQTYPSSLTYPGQQGFFGVWSDQPIQQIVITYTGNGDNNFVQLADFQYSTMNPNEH
jgi:hypothetical protein